MSVIPPGKGPAQTSRGKPSRDVLMAVSPCSYITRSLKLRRRLLETLSEELGHTTSCVNDALAPRGAHTKAPFDQSFSIPTHTSVRNAAAHTHTHTELSLLHDDSVPGEGGHEDPEPGRS